MKIDNGSYSGLWGGYIINVTIGDYNIKLETDIGVRGMDIPVSVSHHNGDWIVTQGGRKIGIRKATVSLR